MFLSHPRSRTAVTVAIAALALSLSGCSGSPETTPSTTPTTAPSTGSTATPAADRVAPGAMLTLAEVRHLVRRAENTRWAPAALRGVPTLACQATPLTSLKPSGIRTVRFQGTAASDRTVANAAVQETVLSFAGAARAESAYRIVHAWLARCHHPQTSGVTRSRGPARDIAFPAGGQVRRAVTQRADNTGAGPDDGFVLDQGAAVIGNRLVLVQLTLLQDLQLQTNASGPRLTAFAATKAAR